MIITTCIYMYAPGAVKAWTTQNYPSTGSTVSILFAFIILSIGILLFLNIESTMEEPKGGNTSGRRMFHPRRSLTIGSLMGLYLLRVYPQINSGNLLPYHPIESLISDARSWHTSWVSQASSSRSLRDAVEKYKQRYDRNPPP